MRPAVFFVGKSDGSIDMWDLLDRSHVPSLTQNVCSCPITSMEFHYSHHINSSTGRGSSINTGSSSLTTAGPAGSSTNNILNTATGSSSRVQLLAVGDDQGRLHVLEVPRNLTRKVHKEVSGTS